MPIGMVKGALTLTAVGGLALAACGSSSPTRASSGSGTPVTSTTVAPSASVNPATTVAAGGTLNFAMTLTGAVSGTFANPHKGPKFACGTPTLPDLFTLNDVEGGVGGVQYAFQISINNFTGSGSQTGNVVFSLQPVGQPSSQGYLSTQRPTVTMTDPKSGSFEGDVQQGLNSGVPTIHVKGTFQC